MKNYMMTVLAAATLGVAAAQIATTPTTNVALPGTIPASVTRTQDDGVQAFLKSGGQVQLLGADGAVIGTLNADGTVALVSGATLADARTVRVTPPAGQGDATTYTLARDLSKPGAIKFEVMGPNGKTLSLPLSAAVNRQAGRGADDAGQPGKAEEEHGDQAEKPEKAEKAEHPGKGKGKGK
ncbi:hypothetical protein [Deinococcus apachensis]|uniref:hypothetical protein n=1 Tax=Deinococcus apachensis TaxID=309886 RepID=UPI00036042CB|nr:hypothetical protein [Deinococcus apachensis]